MQVDVSKVEASPAAPSKGAQVQSGLRICLKWIGIPLVVLIAAGAVVSLATYVWAERSIRELSRDGLVEPPARAGVCRGDVDVACASEAARRAERTLAWIPADEHVRSRWLVVARPADESGPIAAGRVFQEVTTGDVTVTMATHPPDDLGAARLVRTVDAGSVRGRLYRSVEPGFAYVVWEHEGEQFRVSAYLLSLQRDWAEVEEAATAAFKAARYAHVPA